MVNYSFGALAELTDSAVSNSIPSIAPVNQHASVVGSDVVIHPTIHPTVEARIETDAAFAVAVDQNENEENSPPVVPVTVIQDASTSLPAVATTTVAAASSQPFFNPHPALTDPNNTFIDFGSVARGNAASSPPNTHTVTPSRPPLATIANSNTYSNPLPAAGSPAGSPAGTPSVSNPSDAAVATAAAIVTTTATTTTHATSTHSDSPSTAMIVANTSVSTSPTASATSTHAVSATVATSSPELDAAISELKAAPLTTGLARAVNATVCSPTYDRKKRQVLREFVDALCMHQKYS